MAHQIFRLADSLLYNQPLLTTQEEVQRLDNYIRNRNEISDKDMSLLFNLSKASEEGLYVDNNMAVIPIQGSLTYKASGWDALCGMTSYEALLFNVQEALAQGATTILLDVDSGGGQAYGCFETANQISSMCKSKGAKLIAYVDGISASAAYGLSVAADEIILNPQAQAGSIGVVTALRNTSEKDKKEGVKYMYVYAGDSKIPYDEEGNFTEGFINDLQSSVDKLYESFLDHVSMSRGLDKDTVRQTQAKMFDAEKALELGLADKVMTRQEFAEYLADINEDGNQTMFKKSLSKNINEEKEKMQLEEMQTQLEAAIADKQAVEAALSEANEKLSSYEDTVTTLEDKVTSLEAQLEGFEKEKLENKLSDRKEALSQYVTEEQLDSLFEATKNLEDSAFETILQSYSVKEEQLDNSDLFTESGIDAEGSQVQNSSVLEMIRQRKAK